MALDAAGFVLGYYDGGTGIKADYWSPAFASGGWAARFTPDVTSTYTKADYNALYNGNISRMVTALTDNSQAAVTEQLTAYKYDQLNRIKQVRAHRNYDATNNVYSGATGDDGKYHEDFTYDGNGNIMTVLRNGNNTGGTQLMDQFTYNYNSGTNQLDHVADVATGSNYTTDIDDQGSGTNYTYDGIGNLTADASEQIATIDWYANGKIKSITRTSGSTKPDLEFVYDPMGNRIVKITKPRVSGGEQSELHWTYTYYVRDAEGNVLAVYTRTFSDKHYMNQYDETITTKELDIYGNRRLGILNDGTIDLRTFTDVSFGDGYGETFTPDSYVGGTSPSPCTDHCDYACSRKLGKKQYEITNHLGNVLETVSDRRLNVDDYSYTTWTSGTKYAYDATRNCYYQSTSGTYQRYGGNDFKVDWYTADVLSYSDYYAFGAQMDGRFGGSYRYDFNGKETDPESDLQDYGMRIYNARLGKFLSVDPITSQYPELTPYQFAGNRPIDCVDLDGAEPEQHIWEWSIRLDKGDHYKNGTHLYKIKGSDYWISEDVRESTGQHFFWYWKGPDNLHGEWTPFRPIGYFGPEDQPPPIYGGAWLNHFGEIMRNNYGPGLKKFADAGEKFIYGSVVIGLTGGLGLSGGTAMFGGSLGLRLSSGVFDYTTQVFTNRFINGYSWNKSFVDVNLSSIGASMLMPGAEFGQLTFKTGAFVGARNALVSSAYELKPSGYNGLGVKPLDRFGKDVAGNAIGGGVGAGMGNLMNGYGQYLSNFSSWSMRNTVSPQTAYGLRIAGSSLFMGNHLNFGTVSGGMVGNGLTADPPSK